ncbi:hypothetical protein GW17_00062143 [Ensete ventricosum]|nr:hypothetical protein GW17_00062143 [Ensete ventricosum]
MQLGTRKECVRSSPKVSGVCQDGARVFARRRPRPVRRLSGVAEKLTGNLDVCWELVGRSPEEDRKIHHKNAGGYRIGGSQVLV